MIRPRWRKVLRELWSNRARTLLVVASIAVGIFAVGTVQHLRIVILSEMQRIYIASNAAHANIQTNGIDEAQIEAIRRLPEVAGAEGRSRLAVKVQVTPDRWETMSLVAIDDFTEVQIDKFDPVYAIKGYKNLGADRTTWPQENEIILERSAFGAPNAIPAGLRVGDSLLLETIDGKRRTVTLSGVLYDPNSFPATFTGSATGYITFDTYERLSGKRVYDTLSLRFNGTPEQLLDEEYITTRAEAVGDRLEKAGHQVISIQVPEPGQLPLQDIFDALALLLTPLGLLALFLSGFLLINTISALMAQQVRQIGVMKAIGAQRHQIVGMYLGAVLIYSVAALAIAIPLTIVVSGAIVVFLGGFINIDFPRWSLPVQVLLLQVGIGLLIPLLAALYPVYKGVAITVREAISDYGSTAEKPTDGWIMRFLNSIRGLSRPLQLSLRNTFRRKARLALTLITLTLGGMLFMTVGSVRTSLDGLIETGLDYYQFDIQFEFARPYRSAQIEQVVRAMPDTGIVESWGSTQAVRIRDDGSESDPLTITALPANSQMVLPTMIEGRWLMDDDQSALVISQQVLASEPDLKVGDTIVLEIADKKTNWVIVGIAQVLGGPPNVIPTYANYSYYSRLTNNVGRANSLQIKLRPSSTLSMDEAAVLLNDALEAAGYRVASSFTIDTLRRFTGSFFDIIVYLLLSMGVLIASVGALGLMGTMSTNVLERTREIGVMRAIGASDRSVQSIVIIEGIIIGWISWLIGAFMAFPTGAILTSTVGQVLFQMELPYIFSSSGLITWFCTVTILAALASFLPAWNASRLTVREILAYQ